MEQHPVPQHIASYEFRLVGDMTIKQFGLLASGVLTALFIYAMPLPTYFKWPLVVFSAFLGFALAFIPIQERPLSQWIIAFLRAVFSPTQYVWEKKPKEIAFLKAVSQKKLLQPKAAPPDRLQLSEYLRTLPGRGKELIEQQEESYLKQVENLFQLTKTPIGIPAEAPTPSPPFPLPFVRPPEVAWVEEKPLAVKISRPPTKPTVSPKPSTKPTPPPAEPKQAIVLPEKPGRAQKVTVKATTTTQLPFPTPPTQPNVLVGMVLDRDGELVEDVLLEIVNSKDISVRALKTNKLGQFRTAFPLENDTYEIEAEKEGYQFDTIKINLKGELVPPIEIRAR